MGLFSPKGKEYHTSLTRGGESEAHIIAACIRSGYNVLRPVMDGCRYDLVIEDADARFWRLQCKTGRLVKGSIQFHTRSTNGERGYRGHADYFACYSPDTGKVYLVPVEKVKEIVGCLRVDPVGKFQSPGRIRWATDYEL